MQGYASSGLKNVAAAALWKQAWRVGQSFCGGVQRVDPSWDPYHEKRITLGGLVDHYATIKRGRRVMFVACGTSYHACLACRQTMEELAELPVRP